MINENSNIKMSMEDPEANETQREDDDVVNSTEGMAIKNPLLIDLVVSAVLKNLDVEGLKNCRLVNKIWNSESTPILKKKSVVRFRYGVSEIQVERFSKYLEEMSHFGHPNFYFSNCLLDVDVGILEVQKIFDCVGNQIKSIYLAVHLTRPSNLNTLIEITKKIPNVEDLEICLSVFKGIRIRESDQEFRSTCLNIKPLDKVRNFTLYSHFSLEYLNLTEYEWFGYYFNPDPTPNSTPQDMAEFIVKLVPKSESLVLDQNSWLYNVILKKYADSHDVQEVTISDITMYVANGDLEVILQVLSKWPISFKKLKLNVQGPLADCHSKDLQALLNRHCSTLEELKIHFLCCWNSVQTQINVPKFPKLSTLNITMNENSKVGKTDFRFDSDLKDHFPLLEMEEAEIVEMFAKLRSPHSDPFHF